MRKPVFDVAHQRSQLSCCSTNTGISSLQHVWQAVYLARYSYGLQTSCQWHWCLWRAQKRASSPKIMDIIKLDIQGCTVELKVATWTLRGGEQIKATRSPPRPRKTLYRPVVRVRYQWVSTKPSCSYSQSPSPQCVFTARSNDLIFSV